MRRWLVCLLVMGALAGCGDDASSAPASSSAAEPTSDPAAANPPEAAPRGPRFATDSYELTATADAAGYHVGQLGQVTLALAPKTGWHVSEEFPVRIDLRGPSSLGLAKNVLERGDAAEFDATHFRFAAPITPTTAGEQQLLATVSFAVCREEQCLPQTETLSLPVRVQ